MNKVGDIFVHKRNKCNKLKLIEILKEQRYIIEVVSPKCNISKWLITKSVLNQYINTKYLTKIGKILYE